MKAAEKKHYADLMNEVNIVFKKCGEYWRVLSTKKKRKLIQKKFRLNNGTVLTDSFQISKKFNHFFISIGPSLAGKIPKQNVSPDHYLGANLLNSIYLAPVTEAEISKIILSLQNSAPGYDEIAPFTLSTFYNVSIDSYM